MTVALRVTAVVVATAVALHASSLAPDTAVVHVLAGAALALVVLAASVRAGWVSWAGVAVLGLAYAIGVAGADLDAAAPMVGVGLYLIVELLDVAAAEPCAREVRSTRAFQAAGVACGAAVVGGAVLMLGATSATTGVAAVVATAACGCVLFVVLTSGARRS